MNFRTKFFGKIENKFLSGKKKQKEKNVRTRLRKLRAPSWSQMTLLPFMARSGRPLRRKKGALCDSVNRQSSLIRCLLCSNARAFPSNYESTITHFFLIIAFINWPLRKVVTGIEAIRFRFNEGKKVYLQMKRLVHWRFVAASFFEIWNMVPQLPSELMLFYFLSSTIPRFQQSTQLVRKNSTKKRYKALLTKDVSKKTNCCGPFWSSSTCWALWEGTIFPNLQLYCWIISGFFIFLCKNTFIVKGRFQGKKKWKVS